MLFRQLFDPATSTYTYLLADEATREALLIDPVREQVDRDLQLLQELGLKLVATIETHVHADHVTGAWLLKQQTGARIHYPASSGVLGADVLVSEGDTIAVGSLHLEVRLTPGHTSGCATYVLAGESMAFTGDALMIRGSGRTDFQQGDARTLYRSVHDQILSLPAHTQLYPGHDYKGRTVTTVREEQLYNPRLGGDKSEDDFVDVMNALTLAHPKRIDVALPANEALGRLEGDPDLHDDLPDPWDALTRSPMGAPHVTVDWVREHGHEALLVDVRELGEFRGPLGHLDDAVLVPLAVLDAKSSEWTKDRPIVTICRSSGRSDRAAMMLESEGFGRVASMVGGMLAWRQADLPVAAK